MTSSGIEPYGLLILLFMYFGLLIKHIQSVHINENVSMRVLTVGMYFLGCEAVCNLTTAPTLSASHGMKINCLDLVRIFGEHRIPGSNADSRESAL
jgi:hypothetical protein